jgi:hypothetical protein
MKNNADGGASRLGDHTSGQNDEAAIMFEIQNERMNVINRKLKYEQEKREEEERIKRKNR